MELGWNEWGNRRSIPEANASDVATKKVVSPEINVVVTGMARRFNGTDIERRNGSDIAMAKDANIPLRNGRDTTPKSLHVVAEKARGRNNELGRID